MTRDEIVMQPGNGNTSMSVVSRTGIVSHHQCLYFWLPHQLLASHIEPVPASAVMRSYRSEHSCRVVTHSSPPPLPSAADICSFVQGTFTKFPAAGITGRKPNVTQYVTSIDFPSQPGYWSNNTATTFWAAVVSPATLHSSASYSYTLLVQ